MDGDKSAHWAPASRVVVVGSFVFIVPSAMSQCMCADNDELPIWMNALQNLTRFGNIVVIVPGAIFLPGPVIRPKRRLL